MRIPGGKISGLWYSGQPKYPAKYVQMSDFNGGTTDFKIRYGTQATPTCFFIGRDGRVKLKSVWLDPDGFDNLQEW